MFLRRARPILKKQAPAPPRKPTLKPLRYFEMIVEWAPEAKRDPRIQRLGFKAEGSLEQAVQSAAELTRMLNSIYCRSLEEQKHAFCRLVAVYEEKAFKDYSAEPLYSRDQQKKALKKHVEDVRAAEDKNSKKPTPKRVRVQ